MATYDSVSIGDTGWTLKIDTGVTTSLATSTGVYIIVEKPDGTSATYTGTVSGTRYILYTFATAPFTTAGTYQFRSKVTFASATLYGDRFEIRFTG
jgi:hypothetical protein